MPKLGKFTVSPFFLCVLWLVQIASGASSDLATEQYVNNKVSDEAIRADQSIDAKIAQIATKTVITTNTVPGETPPVEVVVTNEYSIAYMDDIERSVDMMVSMSWADLKAKRDVGFLVPGQQYRITNYVATTSGDMSSRSANHPFDVIVTADATNVLSEMARAIQHTTATDDYFYGCNLAAWKIQYCLENDTRRFGWAVADGQTDVATGTGGRGVIYRMVDEFNNDIPYDFKGIQFLAYGDQDEVYRYTFDSGDATGNTDQSKAADSVRDNRIGSLTLTLGGPQGVRCFFALNGIVFKKSVYGYVALGNIFGNNCFQCTFSGGGQHNTFGADCAYNVFGSDCNYNAFGNSCQNNTFGHLCKYNTLGGWCSDNSFGSECEGNSIGTCSYANALGNGCSRNVLHPGCYENRIGANSHDNMLGCASYQNSIGQGSGGNAFGSDCSNNTIGDSSSFNTFGNNCDYLYFGDGATPRSFYSHITVESGVQYVNLNCTNATGGAYYQYVTLKSGIVGTETHPKQIVDRAGREVHTTFIKANSREVSVP